MELEYVRWRKVQVCGGDGRLGGQRTTMRFCALQPRCRSEQGTITRGSLDFFFSFAPALSCGTWNNPGFRRTDYCNDNPGSKLPFEKQGRNQSTKYLFIFNAPGLLFPALKSSWQVPFEVINPGGESKCLSGRSWPAAWHTCLSPCFPEPALGTAGDGEQGRRGSVCRLDQSQSPVELAPPGCGPVLTFPSPRVSATLCWPALGWASSKSIYLPGAVTWACDPTVGKLMQEDPHK